MRNNPASGHYQGYYRLVESYRNEDDRICHRTLLNVGFLPGVTPEQLNMIQSSLTDRVKNQLSLFEHSDPVVEQMTNDLWGQLVSQGRIDVKKASRTIQVDSMVHSDAREIGSEWLSYTIWDQLKLSEFLVSCGWNEEEVQLAATQVISRAVYPASELRTSQWIKENSAVCELTGYHPDKITKDKLYTSALKLYDVKDKMEQHLSRRTNELFDLQDKIILYDLTNTYFEGRKVSSQISKRGKSKEKRQDAKLVVLAMVINVEGFIKYTAIHEGNIADSTTLEAMIDKLSHHQQGGDKPVVVLDAGIATQDNLDLLRNKGYHYVCVSRTKIRDYVPVEGRHRVMIETKSRYEVQLRAISADNHTDYLLEVSSPAKSRKEEGMKNLFEQRFEQELHKIRNAVFRKGGIKSTKKVHERIGRARQKYPSVHGYYQIETTIDEQKNQVTDLIWKKDKDLDSLKESQLGVYFIRTDLDMAEEQTIWDIYNTIREIESSFRCLKTDLDLRPVYHKTDQATLAHLNLGILAYWIVNTMRYQFKAHKINLNWKEIVRIGNTQKMITTQGKNTFDKTIAVRKCSKPIEKLQAFYDILQIKHYPFRKKKSVVHKLTLKKNESYIIGESPPT